MSLAFQVDKIGNFNFSIIFKNKVSDLEICTPFPIKKIGLFDFSINLYIFSILIFLFIFFLLLDKYFILFLVFGKSLLFRS